mmetsp:Transcript_15109/g.38851  ORF Transcript_15109/g.38851 Transcript_15109/m.38851 type:complete len:2663 (+) Transcript_15109:417-8405(+)
MCSEWLGVTCGGDDGRVQEINLRSQGLDGILPVQLSALQNLQSLDLSFNSLSQGLPIEWSGLTALADISLTSNFLSGTLPEQWSTLRDLASMTLSLNALQGSIPVEWSTLKSLTSIDLDNNCLTGSIPDAVQFVSSLPLRSSSCDPAPPEFVESVSLSALNLDIAEGGATASYIIASPGPYPVTVAIMLDAGGAAQAFTTPAEAAVIRDSAGVEVLVQAVDDSLVEGVHSVVLSHTSDALPTGSAGIDSITVTIQDNDEGSAAILVGAASAGPGPFQLAEGGSTVLQITLASGADQPVSVSMELLDTPAALSVRAQPSVLTFSSANFDVPQEVALSVGTDGIATGDIGATLRLTASSLTAAYSGIATVAELTLLDADSADLLISPTVLAVTEGGQAQSVIVALAAQPTQPVFLSWTDPTRRLQLTPASSTVLPGASVLQAVFQVTALRDGIAQGDTGAVLQLALSTEDPQLQTVPLQPVTVSLVDSDVAGLRFDAPSTVTEGDSVEVQVSLATQPLAEEVEVELRLGGEAIGTLVFITREDWVDGASVWKPLAFGVRHDGIATGDRQVAVSAQVASGDGMYADLDSDEAFTLEVLDIDIAALCFEACSSPAPVYEALEGGKALLVTVALASIPTAGVTLSIDMVQAGQVDVNESALAVGPLDEGLSASFSIQAVDDQLQEGDQAVQLCVSASSDDAFYNGLQTCAEVQIQDSTLVSVEQVVSPAGGTITTFRGFGLDFPPAALPTESTIRVQQIKVADLAAAGCAPDATRFTILAVYSLTAEGVPDFGNEEVTIGWPRPAGGQAVNTLQCITAASEDGCGGWQVAPGLQPVGESMLQLRVAHFSQWALAQVHSVVALSPASAGQLPVFVEEGPSVALAHDAAAVLDAVEGFDGVMYTGVIVAITSGHDPESDELLMGEVSGFTAAWERETGELSISALLPAAAAGVAANALHRALAAVHYRSSADAPDVGTPRTIALTIVDEHTVSEPMPWATVSLVDVPDPPAVATTEAPARCVEGGGTVSLDRGLRLVDADSPQLRQARVWMEPTGEGDVLLPPATIGSGLTASAASRVWTLSGLADIAVYQDLLRRFTLRNDGPRVDVGGRLNRTVWFSVEDTSGMQGSASRVVEMVPVNDPPVIAQRASGFTINEEATHVGQIVASDPDGDEVVFSIACPASAGSVEIWPNGTFAYTGLRDRYGSDIFLVQADDGAGGSDVGTVQVTIINTPDPPTAEGSRVEGVWLGEEASFDVLAADPDGSPVWVYITREPSKGVLHLRDAQPTQPGSSRMKGRNPLSYAAPADGTPVMEEVSFEFVAVDESSEPPQMSPPAVVQLVLRNPAAQNNTPPEAAPLALTTTEGHPITGSFVATDDTSRQSQLSYQLLVPPALGNVTVSGGTFTYAPYQAAHGLDSFIYVALDHFSAVSNPARVSIRVEERNDPPLPACEPNSHLFGAHSLLRDALMATTEKAGTGRPEDSSTLPSLADMIGAESGAAASGRQLISLTALAVVLGEWRLSRYQWACSAVTRVVGPMALATDSNSGAEVVLLAYDSDERTGLNHTLINAADLAGSVLPLASMPSNSTPEDAELIATGGLSPVSFRYRPPPLRWGMPLETLRWVATDSAGLLSEELLVEFHVECAPGHLQEPGGRCSACAAGTFNLPAVQGQSQCFPCPVGTHMPEPGAVACLACPANAFQDAEGQSSCQACPDPGMRSEVGSQSAADCVCGLGFYVGPGRTCAACPEGTLCDELGQAVPKPAAPGLWVDPESGALLECKPASSCMFHRTVADVVGARCADGYTGNGCLKCRRGRYRSNDGLCKSCSRFTWVMYVVTALGLLLLIPVIVKLSSIQAFGSINILVAALQANSILMQLDIQWPPFLKRFFRFFAIFALKFDVMSPECVAQDWHYLNKLVAFDLLPALALPAMALYFYTGIRTGLLRPPEHSSGSTTFDLVSRSMAGYSAPFYLMLSWGYYTLVDVNAEYFNCFPNKGRHFMVVEPSIECWSFGGAWNRHATLLPVAAPALLLYGAGIPSLFGWMLLRDRRLLIHRIELTQIWQYRIPQYHMSEEQYVASQRCGSLAPRRLAALERRCGFLFRRYTPQAYWWELVVLARKLALVLIKQISSPLEQTWVVVVVLLVYTGAVMRYQPYENKLLVRMDMTAMCLTIFVTITGFIFYSDSMPDISTVAGGYVLLIMLVGNAAVMAAFVVLDSYPSLMKAFRLQRLQRSQMAMDRWRGAWFGSGTGTTGGAASRLAQGLRLCCGMLHISAGAGRNPDDDDRPEAGERRPPQHLMDAGKAASRPPPDSLGGSVNNVSSATSPGHLTEPQDAGSGPQANGCSAPRPMPAPATTEATRPSLRAGSSGSVTGAPTRRVVVRPRSAWEITPGPSGSPEVSDQAPAGREVTATGRRRAIDVMQERAPVEAPEAWQVAQHKMLPLVRVTDEQKEVLHCLRAVLSPGAYPKARDAVVSCKDAAMVDEFRACAQLLFSNLRHGPRGDADSGGERWPPTLPDARDGVEGMDRTSGRWRAWVRRAWQAMISVGYAGESYKGAEARHMANYREACEQGGFRPRVHGFLASHLIMPAAEWLALEPSTSQRRVLLAVLRLHEQDPRTAELRIHSFPGRSDGASSDEESAESEVGEPHKVTLVTAFELEYGVSSTGDSEQAAEE